MSDTSIELPISAPGIEVVAAAVQKLGDELKKTESAGHGAQAGIKDLGQEAEHLAEHARHAHHEFEIMGQKVGGRLILQDFREAGRGASEILANFVSNSKEAGNATAELLTGALHGFMHGGLVGVAITEAALGLKILGEHLKKAGEEAEKLQKEAEHAFKGNKGDIDAYLESARGIQAAFADDAEEAQFLKDRLKEIMKASAEAQKEIRKEMDAADLAARVVEIRRGTGAAKDVAEAQAKKEQADDEAAVATRKKGDIERELQEKQEIVAEMEANPPAMHSMEDIDERGRQIRSISREYAAWTENLQGLKKVVIDLGQEFTQADTKSDVAWAKSDARMKESDATSENKKMDGAGERLKKDAEFRKKELDEIRKLDEEYVALIRQRDGVEDNEKVAKAHAHLQALDSEKAFFLKEHTQEEFALEEEKRMKEYENAVQEDHNKHEKDRQKREEDDKKKHLEKLAELQKTADDKLAEALKKGDVLDRQQSLMKGGTDPLKARAEAEAQINEELEQRAVAAAIASGADAKYIATLKQTADALTKVKEHTKELDLAESNAKVSQEAMAEMSKMAMGVVQQTMTDALASVTSYSRAQEELKQASGETAAESQAAAMAQAQHIIAGLAQQAAVYALMETAQAVSMLAGVYTAPLAAGHFAAAALFAGIAGISAGAAFGIGASRGNTKEEDDQLKAAREKSNPTSDSTSGSGSGGSGSGGSGNSGGNRTIVVNVLGGGGVMSTASEIYKAMLVGRKLGERVT